jgi:ElaB/YqjD/DUF883 family membrane-anchored ribosome-binding protein
MDNGLQWHANCVKDSRCVLNPRPIRYCENIKTKSVDATNRTGRVIHSLEQTTSKNKNMNKETQASSSDLGQLAEKAHALMAATADVTDEHVATARKRLADALESAKAMAAKVREKAVAGAKATNEAVHQHPYQAIAIGVGVGMIAGYFLGHRSSRNRD